MWSRCFPSYARLHELLQSDCIGELTHIQVQHGCQAYVERTLGDSITLDLGLYALQLGQLIYSCAPVIVKCNAQLNHVGVNMECEFFLDYGQNRKLTAFISGLENLENCAKLLGTKGEIKVGCCMLLSPILFVIFGFCFYLIDKWCTSSILIANTYIHIYIHTNYVG